MSLPRLPVGERIRYYRERAHRTQAAVAGLCGITDRYLSLIENGQKTPSAGLLARLAHELGVPITALLSDDQVTAPAVAVTAAPDVARALMGFASPSTDQPCRLDLHRPGPWIRQRPGVRTCRPRLGGLQRT
jgi:Predicted transcriptional regulators